MITVSGAGRHYGFGGKWKLFASVCINQCFAKADTSGDVCFLFRKLYQVSVNANVRAVRSESKTVLVDAHARGRICSLVRNDSDCNVEHRRLDW